MTKEEKELLLKDLCSRLPYGVKVKIWYQVQDNNPLIMNEEGTIKDLYVASHILKDIQSKKIKDYKPFLRPMSSMTEAEREEFERLSIVYDTSDGSMLFSEKGLDWLNAHHFDYRGLIPLGLALEAPKGMYI